MTACPRCGQENRSEASFCDACGSPIASTPPREERKVVTVLFADLVGFTDRAEQLDPEDVRALQDPFWQQLRSEIERHSGTVEKFIGDAVVAFFGAPVAHEDDPERAVRAALAIRDWAQEHETIQVRIGITTGEALVRLGAEPLAGEGMASGDVVNTASRLQAAARANGILVDETTRRATSDTIDYADHEPVTAKGKAAPIRVWEARQSRSRFGVDLLQHARTPLVGRKRELDLLNDALTRVREERSPQLVTLAGVPGMGKSRLVYELMRTTADDPSGIVSWRQGRSLPYGDGVSFWALAEIVKAEAGILESDDDTEAHKKLMRAVEAQIDDAAEAEWVERHLRPLAGVGSERDSSAENRNEAFAAWRRFFEALADWRPTVLVFEDLHWADDGLLDFVDTLVDWVRDVPLLIVATARPELLERRPSWSGGKANAATLSLSPLSDEETAQLVGQLVDRSTLTPEAEQALVAHAGGNALYAEQYAQMWQERGHAEQLPPPETVQGIIAARLDALSASEKSLLQNAAVFGKVFWEGAVVAVNGADRRGARDCLHALERKEFVQRARRSSVEGESEYAFRHVLVRDVAYNQIPRASRAEKHEHAAAWIESLGRIEDHAEMLAHHYLSAFELAGAAGRSSDELIGQAVLSLIRAGERAFTVNAFPSAAGYYERALRLLLAEDQRRPQVLFGYARALFASGDENRTRAIEQARTALLAAGQIESAAEADTLLADVAWLQGQRGVADEHLHRATALVGDRPPSPAKAGVLSAVARFRMLDADYDSAIKVGRQALEMAERFGLEEIRSQTLITVGTARYEDGDDAGRRDIERGLELALATNHLSAAARGYQNLSLTTEDPRRVLELLAAGEELRLRLGDIEGARYTHANRAGFVFALGHWDEALPAMDAFIADCDAGRPHYQEAFIRAARGWIRLGRDDVAGAGADNDKSLAVARAAKDPQVLFATLGNAAFFHAKLGRLKEASRLGRELVAAHPRAPRWSIDFVMIADRLGLAADVREAFADGPPARARNALILAAAERRFVDAGEIATRTGRLNLAAELRVVAAEALLEAGRSEDACAQLEQALAFYRSVGASRFIRETEALLAASRPEREVTAP